MYRNILVATGGSPWSDAAVNYAIAISARTGATLRILTVLTNPGTYTTPDVVGAGDLVVDLIERQGQEMLAAAVTQAHTAGVTPESLASWGNVAETILQTADQHQCDLVILGARMVSGWKRLRLGHIANAVTAKAKQPVLVVKQPPSITPGSPLGRRILVATGGSPWSEMAVEHAIELAQTQRLALCLLYVLPKRAKRAAAESEGRTILKRSEAKAAGTGVPVTSVLSQGDISSIIADTAMQQNCDGIILGTRGTTGWKRLMIGSISNAVTVRSALPVLIVKRHFET